MPTAPARGWERWFVAATSFAVRRPGRTLAFAVALALLSLASVVARLEIKSSNLDLLDPRLPEIVRFRDFARRFGTPNMLVVALEGGEGLRFTAAAMMPDPPSCAGQAPRRRAFVDHTNSANGRVPYHRSRDPPSARMTAPH